MHSPLQAARIPGRAGRAPSQAAKLRAGTAQVLAGAAGEAPKFRRSPPLYPSGYWRQLGLNGSPGSWTGARGGAQNGWTISEDGRARHWRRHGFCCGSAEAAMIAALENHDPPPGLSPATG